MYTVCPECKTAFRLNAKILKQAHGRVRCGGCSSTFNAIDHLSEDLPDDDPGNTQTAHTFDERSKELLHTLDQLTGPDAVRIEDTGVEWRVLDVDSDSGNDGDDDSDSDSDSDDNTDPLEYQPAGEIQWSLEEADDELPADTGSTAEYSALAATELEASDEPENNHSEQQPAYSDDIGIGEDDDSGDAEIEIDASDDDVDDSNAEPPADETTDQRQDFRYDDNTPLPDEFFRPSDDFPVEPPEDDSAIQEPAIAADPDVDETPTMAGDDAQA
ncbi:MAG: zinc-ribbon domain-containing protein, partial [Woeseia sp.]